MIFFQGIAGTMSVLMWMFRYLLTLLLVAIATQLLRAEQGRTKTILGKFIASRKIGKKSYRNLHLNEII